MTGDWETMKGLRKGDVPNPLSALYKAYLKWCERHGVEPAEERGWRQYLEKYRGYQVERHKEKQCLMLSKWVVPKSTMFKIKRKRRHVCKYCGSKYTPKISTS